MKNEVALALATVKELVLGDRRIEKVKAILAGTETDCSGNVYSDPMRLFESAYYVNHCGDGEVLQTCVYSMCLQSCVNSKGLQVKVHGKRGKGKTGGVRASMHCAPPESVTRGSFSDMALFRKVMGMRHPRIMLDDVVLSEKQTANIKRATSDFQNDCEHSTIVDNKSTDYFIPARSVFFMTSVNEAGDDQLGDRFVTLGVSDDAKDDEMYAAWEDARRRDALADFVVNEDVLLCRSLIRYLDTKEFAVHTPSLKFSSTNDRRLMNIVYDLMSANAILYHMQRRTEEKDGIIHVWADERDLNAVIHMSLFKRVDAAADARLSPAEQKLHEALQAELTRRNTDTMFISEQEIADLIGKTKPAVRNNLYGKGGNQRNFEMGLMAKAPWMGFDEEGYGDHKIIVRKHSVVYFGQFAVINPTVNPPVNPTLTPVVNQINPVNPIQSVNT